MAFKMDDRNNIRVATGVKKETAGRYGVVKWGSEIYNSWRRPDRVNNKRGIELWMASRNASQVHKAINLTKDLI